MAARVHVAISRFSLALWTARLAWALVLLLVVTLMVVNAPANLVYTRLEYQVSNARPAILSFTSLTTFAAWLLGLRYLVVALYTVVALLIAWYRWRDWYALLVSATLVLFAWALVLRGDQTTWVNPRGLVDLAPVVPMVAGQLPFLGLIALFFLFPDGRLVFRWHRWPALFAILLSLLFFIGDQHRGEPHPYKALLEQWAWPVWIGSLFIALTLGLSGQVHRYRRQATRTQQQQMKWVVLGLASILAVPILSWPLEDLGGAWGSLAAIGVELVLQPLLPVTLAFSMFRYRLWDVDLLINRTLVYGGLTLLVLALYALAVGAASQLLPMGENALVPFLTLLIAAAAIPPARRYLQQRADRWLPQSSTAVPVLERDEQQPSPSSLLRPAQIGWLALATFLVVDVAMRAVQWDNLVAVAREEWLIAESLRALPWVSAATFASYVLVLRFLSLTVFVVIAAFLFWRQRDNGLVLFAAYALLLANFGIGIGSTSAATSGVLGIGGILLIVLFPFWFPDGRFVPRSARWRAALVLVSFLVPLTVLATVADGVYASMMSAFATLMVAGVSSLVYRYRHLSTPVERQQIKWVLLGVALQLTWIGWLLFWLSRFGPIQALILLHLGILVPIALPVTIAFSVLRYRLWDIDLLINRALVFAGLTLVVTLFYGLLVGLFSYLMQSGRGVFLSIAATGLIAILFHPARQRLQRAVNRLMYGDRDDPVTVLTRLGERLETVAAPGASLPALVETIAGALKLPYVAVELPAGGGEKEIAAATGALPQDINTRDCRPFPLVYQSENIGALLVSPRAPGETFSRDEERLLLNVARQAGAAVYAARLTEQLQRSRERLVAAREEERLRLRRDLHDGLGPRLATLSLKADAARNYLARQPQKSEQLLLELKAELQSAIGEIRQIAHDLRPPALDQLGLVSALREHAAQLSGHSLHVDVEAPATLPLLPPAVEVAVFRIALEALTNVTRHAAASHCRVTLAVNGGVSLLVRDNGRGLPGALVLGVGLASMRERAAELGGSFSITAAPGGGTELRAFFPLALPE